ncbi:MAG: DUF6017 domain-containing protein [Ruminococcus sp.]|nr:DUF6017 domain-containing protein [Ruminococcus sp.]
MMNIKFIKLPKALFEGTYTELSSEGKLLYALLLDRSLLSEKNSLTDDNGRVIVYFTNSEVCDKLKCSHDKATKLFRELERFKLICRHKQGKGKPDLIYVRQIARSEYSAVNIADDQDSGMRQISVTECGKAAGNNTDYSNTELSNTNLSIRYDEMEDEIKYQIEYDVLSERSYGGILDEIVSLITDTYCSGDDYVWIAKRKIPIQTVRKRLSKLTAEHIEYVIGSLEKNTTEIKNMRAYLLTALYNSIDTLEADGLYGN